jgi:protein-disulfide isomerase
MADYTDHTDEDPQQQRDREPPQAQHVEADEDREPHDEPAATGRRRTRLRQLAIVATIVVVALIALVVAAGGSSAPPEPDSANAITTARGVSALLGGIPQSTITLGQPRAPVTLEWYGDLECPYCREFTLGALSSIIQRWVRGGQLKIEYLSMETATRELKVFQTQQVAALAAGLQNKLWNFIEIFYHEQGEEDSGYVTEQYLHGLASQISGLNVTLWGEDRFDPQLVTQVTTERQAAIRAHYRGTPTFLIGLTGGRMYKLVPHSLTSPKFFNDVIEYLLTP